MALTKITSAIIEAGAIDATALADNSITIAHLDCSDGTAGQFLKTDGSGTLSFGSVPAGYTDSDVDTKLAAGVGNILTTGYIAGPATFTIDPAAVGDNTGTLVVAGNLQVDGTTTTINSTTMTVDDLNITLASGAANAAAANGAGITVDGASATLLYQSTHDAWSFNKNVGIGTTSPSQKLTVSTTSASQAILISTSSADSDSGIGFTNDARSWSLANRGGLSDSLVIRDVTAGADRVVVDSSGNVGIGVTPESWYTGGQLRALQVGGTTAVMSLFDTRSILANNYYLKAPTGADTYINTDEATQYYQEAGTHIWKYAPSGTADTTITWSEAMRISASGNVGIGTSSPLDLLHLESTSGDVRQLLNAPTNSDAEIKFAEGGAVKYTIGHDAASDNFVIGTTNVDTQQRLVIDSSGNVGIGTTSPSSTLDVKRDTNTANNLDSLGFDVAALIGNAGSNPGNHYTSGLRIYQGSGTVGSGLGVMHLGADNGTSTVANQYTAQILAPSGMTGGIKLTALDSAGAIKFNTGGNTERMTINSNGNVEIAEELILDSVGQSEWGMVKLDSQQLSGTYSQVEISISPSYSGYSVYKMIINRFQLAADGELWCSYMYGTTKKNGWYGGYSRAGEGNSTGQEGYSNQPQCEIVGTNSTATLNNSYPFVGEFTFYPLENGNRGKIVWRGIARLATGLTQSIFGAALTTRTEAVDKIVFYSNQNISKFDYVLYGIKV